MGAAGLQDSQPLQQWVGEVLAPLSVVDTARQRVFRKPRWPPPPKEGVSCLRAAHLSCACGDVAWGRCVLWSCCAWLGLGVRRGGGMEGGRERGRRATGGRTPGAQPGSTSTFI